MYQDCKGSEASLNEMLKNLVSKLIFKTIIWKIKITEGDQAAANKKLKEIESLLEKMKVFPSSLNVH